MEDMGSTRIKLTPRIVNTFIILALQYYFEDHEEFTYTGNDYDTKIDVTTGYSEDGKSATTVPIVTVENGPISITPAGVTNGVRSLMFRDSLGPTNDPAALVDTKHDFLVHGSTEISLFSFTKDATDELAFEIAMFIMMLKYNVGNILQIQNIDTCSISPARQVDVIGWTSKWSANLVFPYTFSVSRMQQPIDTGVLLRAIHTTLHNDTGEVKLSDEIYAEFTVALKNGGGSANENEKE